MSQDISTEDLNALIELAKEFNLTVAANDDASTLSALLELKRRREEDRWIPVTERLPLTRDEYQIVAIGRPWSGDVFQKPEIYQAWFEPCDSSWADFECIALSASHWRPMPAAPKES